MKAITGTLPRLLALAGLATLFVGFVVIVAGLAKLQKKTNALGRYEDIPSEIVQAYDTTMTQALIQPYAGTHGMQFAYIWFIIFFNLFNFLFGALILAVPGVIYHGRGAALALYAICTTLTIMVVNNLTYLHFNPTAITLYGKRDINVTFAGSLLVVIGDFLVIIFMGLWNFDTVGTSAQYYGTNKRNATTTGVTEPAVATTTV